jgi:cytochrome c-type biogenesis protein CcmH
MRAPSRRAPSIAALALTSALALAQPPAAAPALPSVSAPAGSSVSAPAEGSVAAPADPDLEQRVTRLAEVLRCLVCQNQTIADSNADLAVDLRNQIREKLAAGMSEEQITEFMVERYGDFVLYQPPVKATTWVLWFGPFLLLIAGLGFLYAKLRSRASARPDQPLSDAERRRAEALLEPDEKREPE